MLSGNVIDIPHLLLFCSLSFLLFFKLHFSLSVHMETSRFVFKNYIEESSISSRKETFKGLQRRVLSVLVDKSSQSSISSFLFIEQKFESFKRHVRGFTWKLTMYVISMKLLVKYKQWKIRNTTQVLKVYISYWKSKSENLSKQILNRSKYKYPQDGEEIVKNWISRTVDCVKEVNIRIIISCVF